MFISDLDAREQALSCKLEGAGVPWMIRWDSVQRHCPKSCQCLIRRFKDNNLQDTVVHHVLARYHELGARIVLLASKEFDHFGVGLPGRIR